MTGDIVAKFESMKGFTEQELLRVIAIKLSDIWVTLEQMKEQERQYWEAWKQAKEKEQK